MKKTVLITGVFDILHQEHINFLKKAKIFTDGLEKKTGQAHWFLIGIESDKRVRQLKGSSRPINSQQIRKKVLEDLELANQVFVLPENFSNIKERRAFLKKCKPVYLLVSSHTPFLLEKKQLMAEIGGQLKIICQHNPEISTSKLVG